ncbi:MAG TPA: thioesterase family protein [Steroidobacter sp.]|uniref:thioesterase family protein n=1 Tax=Steroidobacter sp. TaxID=1978227 RepID=UPI002ED81DB7
MSYVYRIEGSIAHPQPCAAGPWDPGMQHGGAPAALIAWAIERMPVREPMQVARMTFDFLRPIPVAPLEINIEVTREGRKIQVCNVTLLHEGVACVRATVLKVRRTEMELPEHVIDEQVILPGPEQGRESKVAFSSHEQFGTGVTLRSVRSSFGELGPGAAWFRAQRPIIADQPNSPLMCVALTGDFCNGVSTLLDFEAWTFINADLTINLARMPVGEWILLDAQTWLGDHGAGLAFAKLGDERGYFGRAIQSLVIERRDQ